MVDTERREHLLLVVDHVCDVHRGWVESDVEFLTQEFEEALNALGEVFASGAIPADCRVLADSVKVLDGLWATWKEDGPAGGEDYPRGNGFWRAFEAIEDARGACKQKPRPQIESVAQLTEQKVPDRQICMIYGWIAPDGAPQFDKLRQEREKPGTHITPDFVPPAHQELEREEAKQADTLAKIRAKRDQKLSGSQDAPESLATLVEAGVSAEQIGKIKGLTVAEVYAQCAEQALERPEERYADVRTERAPQEGEVPEPVGRAMDAAVERREAAVAAEQGQEHTPQTLEQKIIEFHQANFTPQEIATELSTEEVSVTRQKVQAVLKRYEKQPELFGG